jgi:hypothetical protein
MGINTDLDTNIITLFNRAIKPKFIRELEILFRRKPYGATGLDQGRITTGAGDSDYTLRPVEYGYRIIEIAGAVSAIRNITFPDIDGAAWIVMNLTTGGFGIKCIMLGTAGPGVTVGFGKTAWVMCNGADILRVTQDAP